MLSDINLSERKEKILYAIIDSYLKLAEPSGSRIISKKYDIGVSPATIRNEMSDLEDMGLLLKSHISSGRIPSNLAYRYYVNNILHSYKRNMVNKNNNNSIEVINKNRYLNFEKIIKSSANVLSSLTDYLVISMLIKPIDALISHVELIPLDNNDYVLLTVYDSGDVNNSVINFDVNIKSEDLQKINFILNLILVGKNIQELDGTRKVLYERLSEYESIRGLIDYILENEIKKYNRYEISYDGISKIFDFPEYNNLEYAKKFIKFIENKHNIVKLLSRDNDDYIQVYIGNENNEALLKDSTLIVSNYYLDNNSSGKIAIIGPTRMEYDKTLQAMINLSWKINNLANNV